MTLKFATINNLWDDRDQQQAYQVMEKDEPQYTRTSQPFPSTPMENNSKERYYLRIIMLLLEEKRHDRKRKKKMDKVITNIFMIAFIFLILMLFLRK